MNVIFVQDGLLEDVPFGLVDCGWTGSIQKVIRDIRYALGAKDPPKGFYFGLYYLPKNCEPEDYQSFFGPGRKLLRKAFFNNNLFEVVFSAPHGTTEGYLLRVGHSEPILAEPDGQIASYIHMLEITLCRSTASLLDTLTRAEFEKLDMKYLSRVTSALLWRLMWAPDRLEAETYGMLPISDELQDANRQVLAPALDHVSLRQHHVLYRVQMMLGFEEDGAWRAHGMRLALSVAASIICGTGFPIWCTSCCSICGQGEVGLCT